MDVRSSLDQQQVEKVIEQHQLPEELYNSEFQRLDFFQANPNNPKLIGYYVIYVKNEQIYYRVETLYSKETNGYLYPKCSQTYLPNGTLMIAAHDRDLNNDCDFGFHVQTRLLTEDRFRNYHRRFEIMEEIRPIFSTMDIVNLETNHTLYHPVESYTNQTTKTLKK